MLQLKNVQEVVRKGSRETAGVVITQVVNAMHGQSLCMVLFQFFCTYNYLNGRWLCLGADGLPELVKLFRFLFFKNYENHFLSFRLEQEVW